MGSKRPANISGIPAWAVRTGIVFAVLLGGYLTFEFGRIQASYNVVDAEQERSAYEDHILELESQIIALKEEVALLETHRDIDREAYKDVEASLADLQRKIQEQRDAIEFYRGIISPADGGRGLRVQDLKLASGNGEREYNVRLVLVQVKQHDLSVKGQVEFTVDGAQDGEPKTYSLDQLLPADEDSNWPFSFRYFQEFERQLILPEGFEPERINVEARSHTKSIASVKQSFRWRRSQT